MHDLEVSLRGCRDERSRLMALSERSMTGRDLSEIIRIQHDTLLSKAMDLSAGVKPIIKRHVFYNGRKPLSRTIVAYVGLRCSADMRCRVRVFDVKYRLVSCNEWLEGVALVVLKALLVDFPLHHIDS